MFTVILLVLFYIRLYSARWELQYKDELGYYCSVCFQLLNRDETILTVSLYKSENKTSLIVVMYNALAVLKVYDIY